MCSTLFFHSTKFDRVNFSFDRTNEGVRWIYWSSIGWAFPLTDQMKQRDNSDEVQSVQSFSRPVELAKVEHGPWDFILCMLCIMWSFFYKNWVGEGFYKNSMVFHYWSIVRWRYAPRVISDVASIRRVFILVDYKIGLLRIELRKTVWKLISPCKLYS